MRRWAGQTWHRPPKQLGLLRPIEEQDFAAAFNGALRGFRGSPDDAHALAHAAVVQAVIDPEKCNGVCACDLVVDALERQRRVN